MASYKVTYADGNVRRIIASEEYCKGIEGASYELIKPPEPTEGQIKAFHRDWRNEQLARTDFIVPLSDHPQRSVYMAYRTKLRDWPSTSEFPDTRPTLGS
jgi:antirestriction protein